MKTKQMIEKIKIDYSSFPKQWEVIEDFWIGKTLEQKYLEENYIFSNLKPCPRCNSDNIEHVHQDCMVGQDNFVQCRIQCNNCGYYLKKYNVLHCLENAKQWNNLERC